MDCLNCGGKTKVIDTAGDQTGTYRCRKCTKCGHKFYTVEVPHSSAQLRLSRLRRNNLTKLKEYKNDI